VKLRVVEPVLYCSRWAVRFSTPFETDTFFDLFVSIDSSLLAYALLRTFHRLVSTEEPLNSSDHASCHPAGAGAVDVVGALVAGALVVVVLVEGALVVVVLVVVLVEGALVVVVLVVVLVEGALVVGVAGTGRDAVEVPFWESATRDTAGRLTSDTSST
jgi:hypothetical protein